MNSYQHLSPEERALIMIEYNQEMVYSLSLVKGVVVVPMLFKTSRLPLASNSLVDCWVLKNGH
jgi:hypothetical protein